MTEPTEKTPTDIWMSTMNLTEPMLIYPGVRPIIVTVTFPIKGFPSVQYTLDDFLFMVSDAYLHRRDRWQLSGKLFEIVEQINRLKIQTDPPEPKDDGTIEGKIRLALQKQITTHVQSLEAYVRVYLERTGLSIREVVLVEERKSDHTEYYLRRKNGEDRCDPHA